MGTMALHARDPQVVTTNKTATSRVNQPAITKKTAVTNPPPVVVVATNTPPQAATNEVVVPTAPGDLFTNSVEMELVKVPGGLWAGKYEVTQKEFMKVMGFNPSAFAGDNRPVDSVTYADAVAFCAKLTEMDLATNALPAGYYYTLPAESEWESWAQNTSLADSVTSQEGSRGGTSPVGSMAPNSLGLYDVRGNVMEFCLADLSKAYRVLRGANWQDRIEVNLRIEFRNYCLPDETKNTFGFRCVLKQN
jgi:formylglycine-generating enzyme required for sulfatase activity